MYLDALAASEVTWPVKYDDMFPYADFPNSYWTGYFTSRPNSKKQVRDGQANLHASSKLYARSMLNQSMSESDLNDILKAEHLM